VSGARPGCRRPGGGGPGEKSRVLAQDRRLELTQVRGRFQAQLFGQCAAEVVVDLKRVGLPSAAVQREHELPAQALAQRMLADQGAQLGREFAGRAESQARLGAFLQAGQVQLLQPGDLGLREGLITEIGQRRAAPQRQRLVQHPGRLRRVALYDGIAAFADQPLELADVQFRREDPQRVARRRGDEPARRKHPAQP
jgi:hypothetical protein